MIRAIGFIPSILIVFLGIFFSAHEVLFAETVPPSTRQVTILDLSGQVEYQKGGRGDWIQAKKGDRLLETDVIRTGADSSCTLLFSGMSDATVDLKPNSLMGLDAVAEAKTGENTQLGLAVGSVLVKAEKLIDRSSFEVRTPNSIVGIRGTEFEVSVE